jgi:antitoxin (DNA-binding transcriptional repressor) of toxin-antitoxin stability system
VLRNRTSEVLRQVEAGQRLRITAGGRPVAELVPIGAGRRTFVPRDVLHDLLLRAPLDTGFGPDLDAATGDRVDDR